MKQFEESLGSSPTLIGAATRAASTLTEGAVLDNYRIVRLLGAGGMGAVYLAEHLEWKTRHALKTIRPEFAKQQNFAERFQREAKLAMRLKHPHIVACTETGVSNGVPYLVMDYIEGPHDEPLNLRQLLDQRRERGELLDEDEAAAVGLEICRALDYAHSYRDAEISNGVIHRDLKPANILLDKDTTLYIADFGLARILGERFEESVIRSNALSRSLGDQATLKGQVSVSNDTVGTFDYMSPEQREGRIADVRSDVFAMGVILYELLTGRKVVGVPTPPSVVRPGLNPAWDDIILEHALAYDPTERYASAGDFCRAIESVTLNSPEAIPPPLDQSISRPLPAFGALNQEEPLISEAIESPPRSDLIKDSKPVEAHPRMTTKVMTVVIVLMLTGLTWFFLNSRTQVTQKLTANLATSSVPINAHMRETQITTTNPVTTLPVISNVSNSAELRRGLVLYFNFDNIQNDQILDDSGTGNHGTCKSATVTTGIAGSALNFDDDDALVTVPNHPSLNPEKELTLVAWIKGAPDQPSNWPRIIHKHSHTERLGYNLGVANWNGTTGLHIFPKEDAPEHALTATSDYVTMDKQWHHLVGVCNGKQLLYYLDGSLENTISFNGPIANTELPLTIGNGFDGNVWFPFKGAIDEIAIFNRALSEDEVKQLYDLGRNGQNLLKGTATATHNPTLPSNTLASVVTTSEVVPAPLFAGQPGQKWTNSLGLIFVPVSGTEVLFSIWATRVQDFSLFINDRTDNTAYNYRNGSVPHTWLPDGGWGKRDWEYDWSNPGFPQTPVHPVVCMCWDDAKAFCDWLTAKERKTGRISNQQYYRLPTDTEWSYAVGIGDSEGSGLPREKNRRLKDVYPWGTQWPPPFGVGNYSSCLHIDDCDVGTTPVGSFPANKYGLYDVGGNVWEWCEDRWDRGENKYVQRGVGWGGAFGDQAAIHVLSSVRCAFESSYRNNFQGFRLVLARRDASYSPVLQTRPPATAVVSPAVTTQQTIDLDGGVTLDLVWIPPGEFMMGSSEEEEGRLKQRLAQHRVILTSGFWMGKYEVTQQQYQQVMGENPSNFRGGGARTPIVNLDWNQAKAFCYRAQSRLPATLSGRQVRLPIETEWEYACRAGTTTCFNAGDGESDLSRAGWYRANSDGKPHDVGQKEGNAWGLFDMHGNVWEMCGRAKLKPNAQTVRDPQAADNTFAIRGGAWECPPSYCRSAARFFYGPEKKSMHHGFRIVVQ